MIINFDKPIGRVLYIVEGSSTEFTLLRKIFCNLLKYQYIEKRRNKYDFFISKNNSNSKVAVINTKDSNIKNISDEYYLDDLFELLINEYDFPVDKSAIYYLFDRDPKSNCDTEAYKNYIYTLKDPYDNENGKAGYLLISFPSIESYTISNFKENTFLNKFSLGSDAKNFIGKNNDIQFNKINSDTVLFAAKEFFNFLKFKNIPSNIDDFSDIGIDIFNAEEIEYLNSKEYNAFSMLTISLIQLGIISIDE